jgi:hypothetical protein
LIGAFRARRAPQAAPPPNAPEIAPAQLELTIESGPDTYLVVRNIGTVTAQDVAIQPVEQFGEDGPELYNWRRRFALRPDAEQKYLILRRPDAKVVIECRLSWVDEAGSHVARRRAVEGDAAPVERRTRPPIRISELRPARANVPVDAGEEAPLEQVPLVQAPLAQVALELESTSR